MSKIEVDIGKSGYIMCAWVCTMYTELVFVRWVAIQITVVLYLLSYSIIVCHPEPFFGEKLDKSD